jgi:hypothetical protein
MSELLVIQFSMRRGQEMKWLEMNRLPGQPVVAKNDEGLPTE